MSDNAGNVGENGQWEVEEILDKKKFGKTFKYFVKWKGYDSSQNEWVSEGGCDCPDLLKEFEEKRKKKAKPKKRKKKRTPSPPSDDKSSTGTPPRPPVYVDELDFKITDVKGLFNDNGHIVAVVTSDKDADHHLVDVKAVAIQNLDKLIEGLNRSFIDR